MKIMPENNSEVLALSCKFLREGKVISFATDTVYGIAVDAKNESAVELLYSLKKRDAKKPIAIFVKDIETAENIFYFDSLNKNKVLKHIRLPLLDAYFLNDQVQNEKYLKLT